MNKRIRLTAHGHLDMQSIPQEMKGKFGPEERDYTDKHMLYAWYLHEEHWSLIHVLREFLGNQPGIVRQLEVYEPLLSMDDLYDASMVSILVDDLRGSKELGNPPVAKRVKCHHCNRPLVRMVDNPRMEVKLPSRISSEIFYVTYTPTMLISKRLVDMLHDVGMADGLKTFPVSGKGPVDDYVGIYADTALGWQETPYGNYSEYCEVCGRPGGARYSFYPLFEKNDRVKDWTAWMMNGPTGLVVSRRVFHWLKKSEKKYLGKIRGSRGLTGRRFGFAPDEREIAYLPEQYHHNVPPPVAKIPV